MSFPLAVAPELVFPTGPVPPHWPKGLGVEDTQNSAFAQESNRNLTVTFVLKSAQMSSSKAPYLSEYPFLGETFQAGHQTGKRIYY